MKIEINIGKKHFWALVGLIMVLFAATVVIAKTTTVPWTDDRPFHDILYADIIAGKSADNVVVDDSTNVTGNLGVNGNIVAGDITANGNITLGGISTNKWPWPEGNYCIVQGWNIASCPSGFTFSTYHGHLWGSHDTKKTGDTFGYTIDNHDHSDSIGVLNLCCK